MQYGRCQQYLVPLPKNASKQESLVTQVFGEAAYKNKGRDYLVRKTTLRTTKPCDWIAKPQKEKPIPAIGQRNRTKKSEPAKQIHKATLVVTDATVGQTERHDWAYGESLKAKKKKKGEAGGYKA